MIDIEQAKLDPSSVFNHPSEIMANEKLSKQDKIEILHRWAYDEKELLVAEEENMPSTNSTGILDEIIEALHQLGASLEE